MITRTRSSRDVEDGQTGRQGKPGTPFPGALKCLILAGGKPIIRGRRLAVEHILGMLAAGDTIETILSGYPWLDPEDIQACLVYALRVVGSERIEPLTIESHSAEPGRVRIRL